MFTCLLSTEQSHCLDSDISKVFVKSWLNNVASIFFGLFLKAEMVFVKPQ